MRKIFRKAPGGRPSIQYKRKKPQAPRCYKCGTVLPGVARQRPFKMRQMPKTQKRPERPFGGVLCSRCMRLEMVNRARQ